MEVLVEVSLRASSPEWYNVLKEFNYYPRLSGDNVGAAFLFIILNKKRDKAFIQGNDALVMEKWNFIPGKHWEPYLIIGLFAPLSSLWAPSTIHCTTDCVNLSSVVMEKNISYVQYQSLIVNDLYYRISMYLNHNTIITE